MDPGHTRLTVSGQVLLAYGKPHLPSNLRWTGLLIWQGLVLNARLDHLLFTVYAHTMSAQSVASPNHEQ